MAEDTAEGTEGRESRGRNADADAEQAPGLVDVRMVDHFIVAGDAIQSCAERGLI